MLHTYTLYIYWILHTVQYIYIYIYTYNAYYIIHTYTLYVHYTYIVYYIQYIYVHILHSTYSTYIYVHVLHYCILHTLHIYIIHILHIKYCTSKRTRQWMLFTFLNFSFLKLYFFSFTAFTGESIAISKGMASRDFLL